MFSQNDFLLLEGAYIYIHDTNPLAHPQTISIQLYPNTYLTDVKREGKWVPY